MSWRGHSSYYWDQEKKGSKNIDSYTHHDIQWCRKEQKNKWDGWIKLSYMFLDVRVVSVRFKNDSGHLLIIWVYASVEGKRQIQNKSATNY